MLRRSAAKRAVPRPKQALVAVSLECVLSFFNMPNPQTQDPTTSDAGALAPAIQARRARAQQWFESLQQRVCAELERLETEAPAELYLGAAGAFEFRPWKRETGEGGGLGGFLGGRLFEKAAVHTSAATARFSPEMAKTMPASA